MTTSVYYLLLIEKLITFINNHYVIKYNFGVFIFIYFLFFGVYKTKSYYAKHIIIYKIIISKLLVGINYINHI